MIIKVKNQNQLKKKRLRQKKSDEIQKPLWIKSTKKEETRTKRPDEIQNPLWINLNKNDYDSLTENIYNNLNKSEFETTVGKKLIIWKMQK